MDYFSDSQLTLVKAFECGELMNTLYDKKTQPRLQGGK